MNKRLLQIVPNLKSSGGNRQLATLIENLPGTCRVAVLSMALPAKSGATANHSADDPAAKGDPQSADPQLIKRLRQAGADLFELERAPHRWVRSWRAAWSWLRKFEPQVTHVWNSKSDSFGACVPLTIPSARRIVQYEIIDDSRSALRQMLDRQIAGRFDTIVVDNPLMQAACRRWGLPAEKLRLIRGGVDCHDRASEPQRSEFRRALGVPSNAILVAASGSLVDDRNLKDLIWAIDLLRSVRDDIYMVVFGDGPQASRLRRFAEQATVADRVFWLQESQRNQALLGTCDFFWTASRQETTLRSMLESMAIGIPIVASDIPAHRQFIRHDQSGCLVAVGDRAGFARQLLRLLDDRQLATRVANCARNLADQQHRVSAMVQAYLTEYNA